MGLTIVKLLGTAQIAQDQYDERMDDARVEQAASRRIGPHLPLGAGLLQGGIARAGNRGDGRPDLDRQPDGLAVAATSHPRHSPSFVIVCVKAASVPSPFTPRT